MPRISKIIKNTTDEKMLVFIEPEAMDYWLEACEEFEIFSEANSKDLEFDIEIIDEGIRVFPVSGMSSIEVFKYGTRLECGHNRPKGWNWYSK